MRSDIGQGFFLVVRHEDGGDAERLLQRADLLAQRDADLGVERRERLVEQEHLRLVGDGAGERDALLLAAGELVGVAVGEVRQLDQLQHLLDPRADLGGGLLRHLEAEADIVGHRHVGEQRIGLEHHADIALVGRQVGDVAPADADGAGGGLLEAGHHAQRRGLAAAGRAEEGDELAPLDGEVEVLHHDVLAIDFPNRGNVQKCHLSSLEWSGWVSGAPRTSRVCRCRKAGSGPCTPR